MFNKAYFISVLLLVSNLMIAQSSMGLSFQAGGFFPVSSFSNIYENGLGGSVSLFFKTSRSFEIGISGGYTKYNYNTTGLNNEASDQLGTEIQISLDAPLTIIPVMLSGRYIFESSRVKPYIIGEIGAHYVQMDFPSFQLGNQTVDLGGTPSDIVVGFGAGLGFLLKLERGLYIDINGKFNGNTLSVPEFQSSGNGNNIKERNATWISAKAGIYFEL
jgi:hypothetical protein